MVSVGSAIAFFLIIETASFDNCALFVLRVWIVPRFAKQRLHGNANLQAAGEKQNASFVIANDCRSGFLSIYHATLTVKSIKQYRLSLFCAGVTLR